jgi:hypothetical protein
MSGKYRSKAEFQRIVDKFFSNCAERGYPESVTKEVWRQVESFAGYSFSKAHSASFAVESFQSLYLKTYFPMEFMVAVINNFGGSGGNKLWYRKFQRAIGIDVNMYTPIGGCSECGVPTPTATVPPQITVNIYGRQNTPYNPVSNNLQLVYQTYGSTLGPVNNTTSGIQKSLIEGETFLVSPSVDAGGYLNLGAFLRVTDDTCDYLEVNVNVFAAGAYLSSRFTDPTGSLLSDYGCGLQGSINGVSIPVSQSIDVYITPTSTGVCLGSALTPPGLECLNTGS